MGSDITAWQTVVTGLICLAGFGLGLVYVTPGGQAVLALVDFFGGGFIIFVLAMIEVRSPEATGPIH